MPDGLVREAKAKGLLAPEALESMLRDELRRERIKSLFVAADKLAGLKLPPMTQAEVEKEIRAIREQKGAYRARGS